MTLKELVNLPIEDAGKQLAKIAQENRLKKAAGPSWIDGLVTKLRSGDIPTAAMLGAGAMGTYGLAREAMKPREDRRLGNVALDAALGGTLGAAAPLAMAAFNNGYPKAPPAPPPAQSELAAAMQPGTAPTPVQSAMSRSAAPIEAIYNNTAKPVANWFGKETRPAVLGAMGSLAAAPVIANIPRSNSSALRAGYKAVQSGKGNFPMPYTNVPAVEADMQRAFGEMSQKGMVGRWFSGGQQARDGLSFQTPTGRQFAGGDPATAQDLSRRLMATGRQQPMSKLRGAGIMLPLAAGVGKTVYDIFSPPQP